jgi:hypothetical protein
LPESQARSRVTQPIEREKILEELQRMLESSLFRRSKRCGMLLQYVVEETLAGRADYLKERAIGVAVFGRKPTYDTNEDPIVRTTAVEVRKRIAQYYHEAGHEGGVQIEVNSGSYVPQFHAPGGTRAAGAMGKAEAAGSAPAAPVAASRLRTRTVVIGATALALSLCAIGIVVARSLTFERRSPLDAFWAPLTRADGVILAMGDISELSGGPGAPKAPSFSETSQGDRVGFADGMTMARVAAVLQSHGTKFEIRRAGSLNLRDLRRSPAVLIGEMNNPWTRLVEGDMRFRFVWDQANHVVRLVDQQDPGKPLWQVDWNSPYSSLGEDRAIISRVVDPRTEHAVLVLAGCGRDGTAVAGEFVTEQKYLDLLVGRAPRGWSNKNMQIVIATDLINGNSGPPRIIATYFW